MLEGRRQWTLVGLVLALGVLGGCHPRPLPSAAAVAPYAGSWEFRYGDSPLVAGLPEWAQPTSTGWQPTTVLENPAVRDGNRFLWMRTHLVGPPLRDPVLFLVDIDQSYEAYLDGKLIERFGPMAGERYPGLPRIYLPLGEGYAGKTLALRIYSPYNFVGLFGTPLLGGSNEVLREVIEVGLPPAFMGTLVMLLGIGALLLFALRARERAYLYYAGLTIGLGVHVVCRSLMRDLIADLGPAWTYVELGGAALGGGSLCLFAAHMFGSGPLHIVRRIGQGMLVGLLGSAVLVATSQVHIWLMMRPLQYGMLLVVLCIAFTTISAVRRGDSDGRVLVVGVLLTCLLVFFELLMLIGVLPRWRLTISHYTAFVFALSMATLLALRFARVHRRLQNYSTVLQLSLSQTRALPQGEHMQVALGEVLRLIGGERALLFERVSDRKELALLAGCTKTGQSLSGDLEWDSTLITQVQRRKQPWFLLRERERSEAPAPAASERPPRRERISSAAAPLLSRGELLGIIYLESSAAEHSYDKEDLEILLGLGNQVALHLMTTRAVRLELEGEQARRRLAEQGALLQAAGRMASGDLDSAINGESSDELAPLAGALEAMRQDLRVKFQKLEFSNVEIKQLNEELRRQIEARSQRLMELVLGGKRQASAGEVVPGRMLSEHYRVMRTLGKGAMGSVYEVERITDKRRLAAKVLSKQSDRTALLRFAREAQILARLDHPNLVAISDIDITPTGVLFLVMELVRGTTLKLIRERYRDAAFATFVFREVAQGLEAIHALGIIHRDLKPANVLIAEGEDGAPLRVKLADFGVSTLLIGQDTAADQSQSSGSAIAPVRLPPSAEPVPSKLSRDSFGEEVRGDSDTMSAPEKAAAAATELPAAEAAELAAEATGEAGQLTQQGALVGTPMYMAPELSEGSHNARPPSDIFSLGMIAYEIFTGELPFARPPVWARWRHRDAPAPTLASKRPDVAAELVRLVDGCLQLDPALRPTAAELVAALRERPAALPPTDYREGSKAASGRSVDK